MNIREWLNQTASKFYFIKNFQNESEILLSHVLKKNRIWIIVNDDFELDKRVIKYLDDLIFRRSLGEPIAYLTGKKEFWSLSLSVSCDTLIPRPDTEILVEQVLSKINKNCLNILDLGTGCGAIALALASVCSTLNIVGVDKSKKAIQIAKLNAFKLNLKHVSFFYSDWFSNIKKKFHIIISNPPYISFKEIKLLKKDIFFEPHKALFSSNNGLSDIEFIIKKSCNYLLKEGWLLIEHGWTQKLHVQHFFKKYNFIDIQSYKDYGGNDRVTAGKINNK
ncbi:peptide chain release factor N(5)-glutamine methyltransferase [Buchnera aphidicola (Muscaphis stroyani)]|uniref:Release factor glutamine methyltransferase n=1 Tax=Buchnera aphidicola (Muscaphis stroyani) TaxID=1241869 RepID=A0A4D6YEL1_9GAMM|nr:peptide chain release factor N(5)-glutamine methyltransferase [Buchnera aphidicola]QCI24268.1 peptide chain release factor N(5)-glutamine methyltransferase [Buchnera aphidicola (Muscaphis stroyani)]